MIPERTYTFEWTEPGARVKSKAKVVAPDENRAWQVALRVSEGAPDLVMEVSHKVGKEGVGKLETVIGLALWNAGNTVTTRGHGNGTGLIVKTESGDEFEISVVRISD